MEKFSYREKFDIIYLGSHKGVKEIWIFILFQIQLALLYQR